MTSPARALVLVDVQLEYFGGPLEIQHPPHATSLPRITQAIDAATAGLGVLHWAAEDRYCSMLDCWHPDYARVERRPEAERARLLAAQRAAR